MSLPRQLFRIELERALTYRLDFIMRILAKALSVSLISWFLWKSIFAANQTQEIGGITLEQMGVYYLFLPLTLMLVMNLDYDSLSTDIYDGSLSKYLLYPRSYLWMTFVRKIASSWISIAPYLVVWFGFVLLLPHSALAQTPIEVLFFYLIWSLIAFPCFFLLSSILDLLAFWFEQTWSLRSILRFTALFLGGGYVPTELFPEGLRYWVELLPAHSMLGFQTLVLAKGTLPAAETLYHQLSLLMAWSLVSGGVVWILWRRGLKVFSGSGM